MQVLVVKNKDRTLEQLQRQAEHFQTILNRDEQRETWPISMRQASATYLKKMFKKTCYMSRN